MPRNYQSSAAKCPFYKGEDSNTGVMIFCDGVCGAKTLRLLFPDGKTCREHKRSCCRGDWESCQLAAIMSAKGKDSDHT